MNQIDFRKIGTGWKIIGIILVIYVLLFSYAIFMRTITLGFQGVILDKAYPLYLISNVFMIICCLAMIWFYIKKDRKSFIAQGLWFVPHTITIIILYYDQENSKILFQKYLFWVAAGPSIFIPIKIDPIVVQINILGIIALLLLTIIYKKTKIV